MKPARLAATLITVVVLAGCSADADPKVEPTDDASSASPTTVDPRVAENEFLGTYVSAISDSLSTGDPIRFMELSSQQCESCQSLATNLEEAYSNGGRIEGGSWQISDATYVRQSPFGSVWNVNVETTRERWLDRSGKTIRIIQAGTLRVGFAVKAEGGSLKMREIRSR